MKNFEKKQAWSFLSLFWQKNKQEKVGQVEKRCVTRSPPPPPPQFDSQDSMEYSKSSDLNFH